MGRSPARIATAALLLLALRDAPPAEASRTSAELLLPTGFLPVTEEQRALTAVAFAPDACAVVLLDAEQQEEENRWRAHLLRHRRVKVLRDGACPGAPTFTWLPRGGWTVDEAAARTILPDGTILPAAISRRDDGAIEVAFDGARAGAILDLVAEAERHAVTPGHWPVQGELPVIESRFVLLTQRNVGLSAVARNLDADAAVPVTFTRGSAEGRAFVVRDVPPLPDVPFRPPAGDVGGALLVQVTGWAEVLERGGTVEPAWMYDPRSGNIDAKTRSAYVGTTTPPPPRERDVVAHAVAPDDWRGWAAWEHGAVERWMRRAHREADALARAVTAGKTDAAAGDAVRRAILGRVALRHAGIAREHESPDSVLRDGWGSPGDVACLAASLLRAAGVPARLGVVRRRDSGLLPRDVLVPLLLDEIVIGLRDGSGTLWFSPVADVPVGHLPWYLRGTEGLALGHEKNLAFSLPDATPGESRVVRAWDVTIGDDGALAGEVVASWEGALAHQQRDALRALSSSDRNARLAAEILGAAPGARVTDVTVVGLDGGALAPLDARLRFEASPRDGTARIAPFVATPWRAAASAAERAWPVDMGLPREESDVVRLRLPPGSSALALPQGREIGAPPAGLYASSYESEAGVVTARRRLRLDQTRFGPDAWPDLRRWLLEVASADEQSLAVGRP